MAAETETEPAPKRPIIIVKRPRKGGHEHHGGAWKVAYADFVTAMMSLFIVLWLMSADDDVKKAIAAFFSNPSGPGVLTGTAAAGQGHAIDINKQDMKKLAEKIQQALMKVPNFQSLKDHVEITVTSDGLRIELLETEAGMFFQSGKASPTAEGSELLSSLAQELSSLPNQILIEGHTDSKPYPGDGYSNWELSVDRANEARKLMTASGLKPDRISQVRGYADRQLRHPEDPMSASNRRISVIVQYLAGEEAKAADAKEKAAEKAAEGKRAAEKSGGKTPAGKAPADAKAPAIKTPKA